jgi:hypothetical protein
VIIFDASLNQPKIQIMKVVSRSRSQKPKVNWHSQLTSMPPADYFARACSKAEIWEENRLAKTSVIRAPKDLE